MTLSDAQIEKNSEAQFEYTNFGFTVEREDKLISVKEDERKRTPLQIKFEKKESNKEQNVVSFVPNFLSKI